MAYALRMSCEKAMHAARRMRKSCWIIGADTIVIINGRVLGKPRNIHGAIDMLRRIQGKTHRVITGLTLLKFPEKEVLQTCVETLVTMKRMSSEEIERYIKTGEPFDKAGAYAIQGRGGVYVRKIQGSYTNVVGLPLCELYEMMEKACV